MTHLSNPAIQLLALLVLAGMIIGLTIYLSIRAYFKLKVESKSFSEIIRDGERIKSRLERYTKILYDEGNRL